MQKVTLITLDGILEMCQSRFDMATCKYCREDIQWEETLKGFRPIDPKSLTRHECWKNKKPEIQTKKEIINGQEVTVKVYPSAPVPLSSHKTHWHFRDVEAFRNTRKDYENVNKNRYRKRKELV